MWPLSCPLHCTPFINVLNLLDCSSRKFPTLSSNCLFLFKITHMLASLYSSVRMGACLCAHRETSASDPETIPAAGGDTAYLSCFAVVPSHLGNCLSARVCGYVFQKHAPSTSQRYEQRRPWVGTMLTRFGAVSARSPSVHPLLPSLHLETNRDDGSKSPQPL